MTSLPYVLEYLDVNYESTTFRMAHPFSQCSWLLPIIRLSWANIILALIYLYENDLGLLAIDRSSVPPSITQYKNAYNHLLYPTRVQGGVRRL